MIEVGAAAAVAAVLMDDVHYGQRDLGMFFDSGGKMSIIDTGNTSIQIPYSQFQKLKLYMTDQDPSITTYEYAGNSILRSSKSCVDLESIYSNLQFMLQYT